MLRALDLLCSRGRGGSESREGPAGEVVLSLSSVLDLDDELDVGAG